MVSEVDADQSGIRLGDLGRVQARRTWNLTILNGFDLECTSKQMDYLLGGPAP
jgi:hypothetical protein